jgi:hypothetical protein
MIISALIPLISIAIIMFLFKNFRISLKKQDK